MLEAKEGHVFTDDEQKKLILAFSEGRAKRMRAEGKRPELDESEIEKVFDWALDVRAKAVLLKVIFDGQLLVDYIDGEVVFIPTDDYLKELRRRTPQT